MIFPRLSTMHARSGSRAGASLLDAANRMSLFVEFYSFHGARLAQIGQATGYDHNKRGTKA
jgi:hypothetical protein